MKTFTVNSKKYTAKEIDVTALCVFEECGLELKDIGKINKKIFSFLRAYISFCGDIDADEAGVELNQHIVNGGNLEDVTKAFTEALKNSNFFRALNKGTEKED